MVSFLRRIDRDIDARDCRRDYVSFFDFDGSRMKRRSNEDTETGAGEGKRAKPAAAEDADDAGGDGRPSRRSTRTRNSNGGSGNANAEQAKTAGGAKGSGGASKQQSQRGGATGGACGDENKSAVEPVIPATVVTYREGASLAEHLKLDGADGPTAIDIAIPADATSSMNARLRARQLWGTDVYTADSDLVAVLAHAGYYRPTATVPQNLSEVHAVVRAAPHPEDGYPSTSRNGIRSRSWGSIRDGCGFIVESARVVTVDGATTALTPNASKRKVVPTFYPVEKEHIVHTRHSAANNDRKKGLIREVTIQYNLCNEPWMKYSVSLVADQGFKRSLWTCARLRREVLYLETHSKRYELSCLPSSKDDEEDTFKWAASKKALPLEKTQEVGVPLPKAHVDVVADNLKWGEILWGSNSVIIRGKEYNVVRVQYIPRQ